VGEVLLSSLGEAGGETSSECAFVDSPDERRRAKVPLRVSGFVKTHAFADTCLSGCHAQERQGRGAETCLSGEELRLIHPKLEGDPSEGIP